MSGTILLFGVFPPPVGGMAIINQKLADALLAEGFYVTAFNESSFALNGKIIRFSRPFRFGFAWKNLLFSHGNNLVYIALSGGWGQLYDLVTIVLAKIKRYPIVVHHHSFAYLNKKSLLSSAIFAILSADTIHIALCQTMRDLLRNQYRISNTSLLSNLAFYPHHPSMRPICKPTNLGFISIIMPEKGANLVIDLAYAIKSENLPYKVTIAGPCYHRGLKTRLEEAQQDGVLEWKGLVVGDAKRAFWQSIDMLVFPTRFQNEAEPLVVWEAMAAGVPVFTCRRGCIKEQLGMAGYLFDYDNFVENTISVLKIWHNNPELYQRTTRAVRKQYLQMRSEATRQWTNFVLTMKEVLSNEQ